MTKYSSGEDSEAESSQYKRSEEEDDSVMSKEDLDELTALKLVLLEGERLKLSTDNLNIPIQKVTLLLKAYHSLISNKQKKKLVRNASAFDSEEKFGDESHCKSLSKSRLEGNHFIIDDSDGDDDFRACFPCPFCYVDIEVHVLCSHMQEEHCFDLKNAVCPLCAANLGKDAVGHFIVQHASSLKHRMRTQKAGLWPGNSAMLGKELSSFLGSSPNARVNTQEVAPDPLLSPFLSNASHSAPKESQKNESLIGHASLTSQSTSAEMSSVGAKELDFEERERRAAFVQQLIASTIF